MGYDESMDSEKDIFAGAMALPVEKRARLAHELLASLDESADADAAEAWLAEIDRRAREVEEGTAKLEEWSTVRDRLTLRWASK
jgi:putative addiction module component (TIGR02574 family)